MSFPLFSNSAYFLLPPLAQLAQGASALAHLPVFPVTVLLIAAASPEAIPALDDAQAGRSASEVKTILLVQSILQFITSIGHVIPDPKVLFIEEISIAVTTIFLYRLVLFTEKSGEPSSKNGECQLTSWKAVGVIIMAQLSVYLVVGIVPLIFIVAVIYLLAGTVLRTSLFGRFTGLARSCLATAFISTFAVLGAELASCEYLQKHVDTFLPYHVVFDFLFWQLNGSLLDLILITPSPGKWLKGRPADSETMNPFRLASCDDATSSCCSDAPKTKVI